MVAEPTFGYVQGNAVADEVASDSMMRRDPYMTRESGPSRRDSQVRRAPNSAGLYDVLDLILDKGIVIDAFVRVSLVGIELLTVDLRVVIASVDTYLRYAEGAERLQLYNRSGSKRLPDMVGSGMKTSALKHGAESVGKMITGNGKHGRDDDDQGEQDDNDEDEGFTGTIKRGVRNIVGKLTGDEDDEDDEQREHEPVRARGRGDERRSKDNGGGGGGGARAGSAHKQGARR
jgi:hypothetical protein